MGEALDVPQIGCVRHPMHLQQKKKVSDGSDDITAGNDVAEFRLLISPKPYNLLSASSHYFLRAFYV